MRWHYCSWINYVWNAGCDGFTDGMGIAGMRRRVREVNGILDFETNMGFKINMLFPGWDKEAGTKENT